MSMGSRIKKLKDRQNKLLQESEQIRAEKIRAKLQKAKLAEPGTITYGLMHQQKPWDVARDVIERRRQRRLEKQGSSKKR